MNISINWTKDQIKVFVFSLNNVDIYDKLHFPNGSMIEKKRIIDRFFMKYRLSIKVMENLLIISMVYFFFKSKNIIYKIYFC